MPNKDFLIIVDTTYILFRVTCYVDLDLFIH